MKHKTMTLVLLALSQFLVILDSAIINVALPAIKESLRFDQTMLQWVVTAYVLTFGGFLLLGGRTADLFGRRRVLIGGIIGFSVFSLLAGLAWDSTTLVVLRALQGLSAAFMSPAALSILLTTFKEGHERNKALSIWAIVASGGAAVGLFLGGLLTQYLGWRWNFFVNVPIGILTVIGLLKYVPAHIQEAKDKHLDLPGAILVTGGLMALVYALAEASRLGWTHFVTLILLGLSAILLVWFIRNETKAPHPLVPLSIFKIRNVVGGNLIMLPMVAAMMGTFFFTTLYLQNILHYSPVLTGLCFLPMPIVLGIVSNRTPALIARFGFKPLLIIGTLSAAAGVATLSFLSPEASYWLHVLPAFLLIGVGMGLSFVSMTVAATSGVPAEQSGLVSGLINTSNQIGAALGVAVLAVVANAGMSQVRGLPNAITQLHGYRQAFFVAVGFLIIALLMAIFVIKQHRRATIQAKNTSVESNALS